MHIGYNTNGFAHHRLEDAIAILAEIGYGAVAITLDHHALNPFERGWRTKAARVADLLRRHGLRCVVETGARFLLDPRRKHAPTLLDPDPAGARRRFAFLARAVEIGRLLSADAVSFWSGARPVAGTDDEILSRLVTGCRRLLACAERSAMPLAFEPEPGMFIDTMSRFSALHDRLDHPLFGLTLDVGHVHCLSDGDAAEHIRRWAPRLFNVHIEDMRRGVHDHLPFGEGEIDFHPIFEALRAAGYTGGLYVELSRHSHDAVNAARQAWEFLYRLRPGRGNAGGQR